MKRTAPIAECRPATDTHHGITRTDDYAWLRADNWQEVMRDPSALPADIRTYLEAENEFTEKTLASTNTLQDTIFEELKGRIKQDDSSVPSPHGPWAYYSSYVTGGEYPLIARKPRTGGEEKILLDGNAMGKNLPYFSLGGASHSMTTVTWPTVSTPKGPSITR